MPKITKRFVDALRPSQDGKDLFAWDAGDGALKGFGIRVKPSGSAAYLVQYRNREGRTRRLTLGKVGVLTPDQARGLARSRLGEAAGGHDPSRDRHAVRRAITVGELCDLYLADAAARIKASTLVMDRSRIETHVKPLIGSRSVRSISASDIERMRNDIISGKIAASLPKRPNRRGGVPTGGSGVAARTLGMVSTIFEYARNTLNLIDFNPAKTVKKPREGRQRRFLSSEEIRKLGATIRVAEEAGQNRTPLNAIKLLLMTGFRRMELLALPKGWVDVKGGCVRLEDSKSGYQLRVVGGEALKLLEIQASKSDGTWVFQSDRGNGHFVGLPKVLARLCEHAGLPDVTIHVLRHSFAAIAAEMGFSELVIAGLLGHSVPGVTARYAHVADSALAAAADKVALRIATLMHSLRKQDEPSLSKAESEAKANPDQLPRATLFTDDPVRSACFASDHSRAPARSPVATSDAAGYKPEIAEYDHDE